MRADRQTNRKLFCGITSNNNHCLHSLPPKKRHTKALNSLRSRGHIYQLPQIESNLFKNSYLLTYILITILCTPLVGGGGHKVLNAN